MTDNSDQGPQNAIVIDTNCSSRKLIAGPQSDFERVAIDDSEYWMAGQFVNQSAADLAENVVHTSNYTDRTNEPFAAVAWRAGGEVSVVSDRYGRVPLYTADDGQNTWISTRLGWLLRESGLAATPDEQSLAQLMTFKFVLGAATIVKGVSRIPPASTCVLEDSGYWQESRYWLPTPPSKRVSLDAARDELTETFTSAVRSGIGDAEHVGITLSGGLDSRLNLAAALNAKANITTLTTAIPFGMDFRYAEAAAKAAGVPNIRASLDSEYQANFFDLAAESLQTYEGMLLTPGAEPLWLMRHMEDARIDRIFHGALGELAKGATANHFSVGYDDVERARKDIGAYLCTPYLSAHRQLIGMLNPKLASELKGLAISSLKNRATDLALEMDPLDVSFALQIVEHFRNSGVYSSKLWSHRYPIVFPFADPTYVEQLLAVRAEDRLRSELHRHMIGALHSGLYHTPESNTGCKVSASALVRKASKFKVRVQKKLGSRKAKGHTDYCAWINNMNPNVAEVLMGESATCRELWSHDKIPARIEECRNGNRSAAVTLFRMVSIELIFRLLTLQRTPSP